MKSAVIVFTFGAVFLILQPVFCELFDIKSFEIADQITYKC